jgi:pyridoxal phosphate enzyme (YggS family)
MTSETLCTHIKLLLAEIRRCEQAHGRKPGSVQLVAVSKTKPQSMIEEALDCGLNCFGENYAQEFSDKAKALPTDRIDWHFIGPLQSNKTRLVAPYANWVHSIDRLKIAQRLSSQRPEKMPPLNICLQVNIDNEPAKSGIPANQLPILAKHISELKNVRLRGLMCIPKPHNNTEKQRPAFARLRQSMESLNQQGFKLDTLSMGMSGDYSAAIAEGATLVRIGTAIFGARR